MSTFMQYLRISPVQAVLFQGPSLWNSLPTTLRIQKPNFVSGKGF